MLSVAQVEAAEGGRPTHASEPHSGRSAGRLNGYGLGRGRNDGIVSVAAASSGCGGHERRGEPSPRGLAGLVGGPVSLARGAYDSVSSRAIANARGSRGRNENSPTPGSAELTELTALYEAKGLYAATARSVAEELTAHGALAAHLDANCTSTR